MGISLGVVGLGSFGSAFAPLFMGHPAVDRIALCDQEPGRLRRFSEAPEFAAKLRREDVYDSFEGILASDLDALALITQPWLHAPQAIAALEAGKHVYSAVPVVALPDGSEILEWCDRLIETVSRTGQSYMLGETTVFRPEAMYCRRRAAEGAFGAFVYAEGEYYHPFDSPSCDLREVNRMRHDSPAGRAWEERLAEYRRRGVPDSPMHYPTHSVSGPIHVMGAHAVKVSAWGFAAQSKDAYFEGTPYSNETALFKMSNGATLRINEYREIGLPGSETFRLFGTEGSYTDNTWLDKAGATTLDAVAQRDPLPEAVVAGYREALGGAEDVLGGHGGSHAYLVHAFVEAINAGRTPPVHAWEAVRYMAAGVTAHQSALRDGERLDVPDWGDPSDARP